MSQFWKYFRNHWIQKYEVLYIAIQVLHDFAQSISVQRSLRSGRYSANDARTIKTTLCNKICCCLKFFQLLTHMTASITRGQRNFTTLKQSISRRICDRHAALDFKKQNTKGDHPTALTQFVWLFLFAALMSTVRKFSGGVFSADSRSASPNTTANMMWLIVVWWILSQLCFAQHSLAPLVHHRLFWFLSWLFNPVIAERTQWAKFMRSMNVPVIDPASDPDGVPVTYTASASKPLPVTYPATSPDAAPIIH